MTVETKFDYEQHVRHRLTGFLGYVVGISVHPVSIEYEVLPLTDREAKWVSSVWVDERFLEEAKSERD